MNNIFFNTSDIFVKKWVESNDYGLGYILSNDNVGAYFNDNTKMIYKPNGNNFIYIEKNEKYSSHMLFEKFNNNMSQKVNILQKFKGFLLEESKDDNKFVILEGGINAMQFIYIKKFEFDCTKIYIWNHE